MLNNKSPSSENESNNKYHILKDTLSTALEQYTQQYVGQELKNSGRKGYFRAVNAQTILKNIISENNYANLLALYQAILTSSSKTLSQTIANTLIPGDYSYEYVPNYETDVGLEDIKESFAIKEDAIDTSKIEEFISLLEREKFLTNESCRVVVEEIIDAEQIARYEIGATLYLGYRCTFDPLKALKATIIPTLVQNIDQQKINEYKDQLKGNTSSRYAITKTRSFFSQGHASENLAAVTKRLMANYAAEKRSHLKITTPIITMIKTAVENLESVNQDDCKSQVQNAAELVWTLTLERHRAYQRQALVPASIRHSTFAKNLGLIRGKLIEDYENIADFNLHNVARPENTANQNKSEITAVKDAWQEFEALMPPTNAYHKNFIDASNKVYSHKIT